MATPPHERSIQCSTGPFWALELEAAFDAVAEAGFADVELMVTRDPATQRPDVPAALASERGLRIASVHGPFLAVTKTVWGTDPLEKIRRGVDMCRALGARCYVVHPPYLWERSYARWIARECAGLPRDTGVTVAVENMYPKWVGARRIRAHQWLEPWELLISSPHVVMDTSHLTVARADVLETYSLLAPKLVHIHLSNNAGDGRDGHLELDTGVVPVERFLQQLRDTRYAGTLALELSARGYLEQPRAMVEALRRNRQYVEERLAPLQEELDRP